MAWMMGPEGILVRWLNKAYEVDLYESKFSMGIHCPLRKKKKSFLKILKIQR